MGDAVRERAAKVVKALQDAGAVTAAELITRGLLQASMSNIEIPIPGVPKLYIYIYMWAGTIGSRRHSSFIIGFLIETAHMCVQVSAASHML